MNLRPFTFQMYEIYHTEQYNLIAWLAFFVQKQIRMDKKVIMIDLTGHELAAQISHNLKPLIKEQVSQVLQQRKEDSSKPLSMAEAADYLNIGSTAFSNLVNRGELKFTSLRPDSKIGKKFFMISDLRDWLESNKTRTINEIKDAANGNI